MKKIKLYLIPGIGETTRAKNYREVVRSAKSLGLKVIPVNINWSEDMNMTDFIEQADKIIPKDISNDYVIGFSFGSYIASVLSKSKISKGYIFCSTSPYFKENLKDIPKESREYWGTKMMNSFKKYTFPIKQTERAWFLIGKKDWDVAIKANKEFYEKWRGKKNLFLIPGAEHDLSHPNYIKKIEAILKNL